MGIYHSVCQKNLWEQNRVHLAVCLSPKLVHSVPPKSMQAFVGKGDLWRHQNCTTAPDGGTVSPQSKSEGLCQSMVTLLVLAGSHLLLQQQTLNYRIQLLLWKLIPVSSLCLLVVSNVLMTWRNLLRVYMAKITAIFPLRFFKFTWITISTAYQDMRCLHLLPCLYSLTLTLPRTSLSC